MLEEEDNEEIRAAIMLRLDKQKHSDFYQRLNELHERITVFNDMFTTR